MCTEHGQEGCAGRGLLKWRMQFNHDVRGCATFPALCLAEDFPKYASQRKGPGGDNVAMAIPTNDAQSMEFRTVLTP